MAPRKAAANRKTDTAPGSRKGPKTGAKPSEPPAAEATKRSKAAKPKGRTISTGTTASSTSGKRKYDATESGDTLATSERRSKKAKAIPQSSAAKKKALPPKKPRKPTAKAPRPEPTAKDTLAVINQAPTKVLTFLVFGSGECGELGLGPKRTAALKPCKNPWLSRDDASNFHVVQLACGGMHTIALTQDNKIVTWGVNDHSALGRDTTWDGGLRDIDADSDSEDGDLNPFESTPAEIPQTKFPPGTKFVQVAAGDSCSFALTDTGLVFGWGTFRDPKGDKKFGYTDGNLVEIQENPVLIPGLKKITQIVCGENHALALDADGCIWGWGIGKQNELGRRPFGRHQETLLPRLIRFCRSPIKYIASGEHHSFAVDSKDDVWAWGLNSYGEAGYAESAGGDSALLPYPMKVPDLSGKGVLVLDGGSHHSAAVTKDGQCLVWGRMDGGQLGVSFTPKQLKDATLIRYDEYGKPRICLRPVPVPIKDVVDVGCGTDHTIFITREGKGYSSGFGSQGQLGLGSEDDQDVAQEMVGKNLKDRVLTWASAGGQFSAIAATS